MILHGIERHLQGLDCPNQSMNFNYSRLMISSNQVVRSIQRTDCASFNF